MLKNMLKIKCALHNRKKDAKESVCLSHSSLRSKGVNGMSIYEMTVLERSKLSSELSYQHHIYSLLILGHVFFWQSFLLVLHHFSYAG